MTDTRGKFYPRPLQHPILRPHPSTCPPLAPTMASDVPAAPLPGGPVPGAPALPAAAPPALIATGTLKPQTLPSGLVLRFEAPSSRDHPITIGTPPGTPVMKGAGEGSGSLNGASSSSGVVVGSSPVFRSLAAGAGGVAAGPSGSGRPSPLLAPLGLPPTRNDTDDDLMQKQVRAHYWEEGLGCFFKVRQRRRMALSRCATRASRGSRATAARGRTRGYYATWPHGGRGADPHAARACAAGPDPMPRLTLLSPPCPLCIYPPPFLFVPPRSNGRLSGRRSTGTAR
jgi:hypothetical protein